MSKLITTASKLADKLGQVMQTVDIDKGQLKSRLEGMKSGMFKIAPKGDALNAATKIFNGEALSEEEKAAALADLDNYSNQNVAIGFIPRDLLKAKEIIQGYVSKQASVVESKLSKIASKISKRADEAKDERTATVDKIAAKLEAQGIDVEGEEKVVAKIKTAKAITKVARLEKKYEKTFNKIANGIFKKVKTEDGDKRKVPAKFEVCPDCHGCGKKVDGEINCTAAKQTLPTTEYLRLIYAAKCKTCKGKRVVKCVDEECATPEEKKMVESDKARKAAKKEEKKAKKAEKKSKKNEKKSAKKADKKEVK